MLRALGPHRAPAAGTAARRAYATEPPSNDARGQRKACAMPPMHHGAACSAAPSGRVESRRARAGGRRSGGESLRLALHLQAQQQASRSNDQHQLHGARSHDRLRERRRTLSEPEADAERSLGTRRVGCSAQQLRPRRQAARRSGTSSWGTLVSLAVPVLACRPTTRDQERTPVDGAVISHTARAHALPQEWKLSSLCFGAERGVRGPAPSAAGPES